MTLTSMGRVIESEETEDTSDPTKCTSVQKTKKLYHGKKRGISSKKSQNKFDDKALCYHKYFMLVQK